jgi:hypothetical protein
LDAGLPAFRQGILAGFSQLRSRRGGSLGVNLGHNHPGPFLGKALTVGPAYSVGAAGDD